MANTERVERDDAEERGWSYYLRNPLEIAKVIRFPRIRSSPSIETQSSANDSEGSRGTISCGVHTREEPMPDPSIFQSENVIRELTADEERALLRAPKPPSTHRVRQVDGPGGEKISAERIAEVLGGKVVGRTNKHLP